jgi:hypothetical protein
MRVKMKALALNKMISWCVVVLCFGLSATGYCQTQCPAELLNKKVAVILGSASVDATSEVVKDVGALLESKLLNCGLQVIDQATVEKIIPEQEKQLILRGDTVGAVTLSEKLGADLLLTGQLTVKVRPIEGMQTNLKSVYVTVSLKLLSSKNSQAVSSKTWSGKGAGVEPSRTVLDVIGKKADELVSEIYQEYCQKGPSIIGKGGAPSVESGTSEKSQEALPSIEGRPQSGETPSSMETPKGGTSDSKSSLENL